MNKSKYGYNKRDGWLRALISEVISREFGTDLCLSCSKEDECKHDVFNSEFSILQIVDKKMNYLRHKMMDSPLNRGHMLALILYTGMFSFGCNLAFGKTK